VRSDAGMLFVTVDRVGGASGPVIVGYATYDATAVAGTDYTATSGSLSWPDGDAAPQTFGVPISASSAGDVAFSLALVSTSGAQFGDATAASVYISPPGPILGAAGVLQFSQPQYTVSPGALGVNVTIDRVRGSSGPVVASYYAAAGTNQTSVATGNVAWPDGSSASQTISIPFPPNGADGLTVSLTSASGASFGAPIDTVVTVRPTATALARLSWTPPSQYTDGSAMTDLAGYYLYIGTPGVQPNQRIQITDPTTTSFSLPNLTPGVWYFAMMAYTSGGNQSDLSSTVSAMIQ
jgi:Calx-beta domain-containing protein/fibronectin type III domain protein